jgi:hypothetical protein
MHEVNDCTGGQSLLKVYSPRRVASGDRQANERRIGMAASTFAEHSAHPRNIISEHLKGNVAGCRLEKDRLRNGAGGISDIEGKATRVGASERGQQTSFN